MTKSKALKMTDIVLVRYLFKEDWAPLEEVVSKNASQFGDVYDVSNEKELLTVIESSPATLVIAAVSGKEELTLVINFLKNQRRVLKESNVKFSAVNYLNNKQVEAALMKLGCQEVMEPTMRDKALKFKIDFWKKSLSVGQKKEAEVKLTLKDKQSDGSEKAKQDANPISWVEALKTVDDMWLIKSQQDVKKVLTRWMVKMMGPSPFVAQWTEVPGQRGIWKFTFKDGIRDTFHSADGDWIFKGDQKPEFVWKENLWMISGMNFQLYYQEEDEIITRFRASPQAVEVAKNSSYALSRERAIIESFDQEILVKKGLKIDDSKTQIEEDKKSDGLLTQDISDQKNIDNYYKNDVEQEIPDAPEEKKRLKVDATTAARLKGKSSTDNLGAGQYDGDVEDGSNKETERNQHSGTADRMGDSDGNAGTEDVGLSKYKGKLEHSHTDRKSDYGGESETDDLGSDKWSNAKNEAPAKEPRTPKEREEREKAIAAKEKAAREAAGPRALKEKSPQGQYDGEGETDDLGSSHWSNKDKGASADKAPREAAERNAFERARQDKASADREERPASSKDRAERDERERGDYEEKSGKGMRGHSETDDLGEGHYSGVQEKKKAKVAPTERERALLADLGDVSEDKVSKEEKSAAQTSATKKQSAVGTDDLGASRYAGKTKRAEQVEDEEAEISRDRKDAKKPKQTGSASDYEEEKKKDYRGQGKSDDLGASHYKGKATKSAGVTEESEEEEVSPALVAKKEALAKAVKAAAAKKMRVVDDLLPEGDGEDPAEDILPGEFEDAQRVDVPMDRSGPRLVVNNEKSERVKPGPREVAAKVKEQTEPSVKVSAAQEEEVLGDDGQVVTNDQVKVKAVLTCKSMGGVEHIVHVDDFFDNTVIVKMKLKSPQAQESVSVTISFDYQKRNKRISVSGKCLETDQDEEGEFYSTIELEPSDLKVFEQFMTLYRLRQQHIHQFLKAAKGL